MQAKSGLTISGVAINQTPLDWRGNLARIISGIEQAKAQHSKLIVFPELAISGYGCEDMFLSNLCLEESLQSLLEILPKTKDCTVVVGLPLRVLETTSVPTKKLTLQKKIYTDQVYNACCVISDQKIQGFAAKRFLARDEVYYEPRWFNAWPLGKVGTVEIAGKSYPVGDIIFDAAGTKFGIEICEDAWVYDRPANALVQDGAKLIINISASHFAFGKMAFRQKLCSETSRDLAVPYVYVNLLGNDSGRIIYDGGTIFAEHGEIVKIGPRLGFEEVVVTTHTVNAQQKVSTDSDAHWESSPSHKEEEFFRAEALGLFDYLRKSKAHGFVVSISGGADSAAVSALVTLMIRAGISALGIADFKKRLDYIPAIQGLKSEQEIIRALLTCVFQATEHNSQATTTAAREVAQGLGATFLSWEIGKLVAEYQRIVATALATNLTWETDGLALQNIQARVRSPGVWLVANKKNALLLSTSNRSEAAVGYATMDGDTSGGLCPIGGVDKSFIRRWLRWLEKEGPADLGSYPCMSFVNALEPSAELKPQSEKQTDEADLMPYEVLDRIEELAIRDKQSPAEVLALIEKEYSSRFSQRSLSAWVKRFYTLFAQNQWKRERYAPSFMLDDENLDPKTWLRFPILSGGFVKQIKELK
ncbi:NAD(+) synthase [bacterium]|nr:NAD(+) synthase [bacterium]